MANQHLANWLIWRIDYGESAYGELAYGKTSYSHNDHKHLRKWLSNDSALKIVTSHYFGQSYYCSPLWMNDALSAGNWNRLRSQHYRALRAAIGDFRNKTPKSELDTICERASPRQWSYFFSAKTAIYLYMKSNTRIAKDLRKGAYINDIMPRRAVFKDTSRLKCGRLNLFLPWFSNES